MENGDDGADRTIRQITDGGTRLSELHGVAVRQRSQEIEAYAQSRGLPYEAANKYRISALPPDKAVKNHPHDPHGWTPTDEELERLYAVVFAHEESNCLVRTFFTWFGCRALRPFKLHFKVGGTRGDVFLVDRPLRLGGAVCLPHEMNVNSAGRRLGRVREDFLPYFSRCISSCCLATSYTDIERALPDGSYETTYTLRANRSCCGRVNNCCGATCCKSDAVYDILDTKGQVVAHLQRTYGRSSSDCLNACFRMDMSYDNFMLEFPRDATPEDRVLLLMAVFQVEYQHFEGGSWL